jgi:uncharacterized membrane protein YccC
MPFLIPIGLKLLTLFGMAPGRALQTVSGRLFGTVAVVIATVLGMIIGYASWRSWLFVHDRHVTSTALAKCESDAWKAVESLRQAQRERAEVAMTVANRKRLDELEAESAAATNRAAELENLLKQYKLPTVRTVCIPRDVARVLNR